MDGYRVEAIVEVSAECALTDALLKVMISRRDHSEICLDRSGLPDVFENPVLEHVQHFGLQVSRKIRYFIQEDSPLIGHLKSPCPLLIRAGKSALSMSEEFALEK